MKTEKGQIRTQMMEQRNQLESSLISIIPEIGKLKQLPFLKDLTFMAVTWEWPKQGHPFLDKQISIKLEYMAQFEGEGYPHVRSKLLQSGVIRRRNLFPGGYQIIDKGKLNEARKIYLQFGRVEVVMDLTVYNPKFEMIH